ncbi:hypothetical protein [uncultured Psychromonas sp.]|uniref:hypothetical protein n=1 Tax=uncultured Psychromonas sp. TaxID=173974 RepID=UPI0026389D0A|nr:hypothetical protein [uncultured Psychromonas sp.]
MSEKFTDHDIARFYSEGATEKPSAELDAKILALAKTPVETKTQTPLKPIASIKKPALYQTWYGQLSTAASLVLVTILYLHNSDSFHEPADNENKRETHQLMETEATGLSSIKATGQPVNNSLQKSIKQRVSIEKRRQKEVSDIMTDSTLPSVSADSEMTQLNKVKSISKMTPEGALEVMATFNKIDDLLATEQREKARERLNELLQKYPQLKADLHARYMNLLK